MSGWDRDERGDYTPPPLPRWIWLGLAAAAAGFFALLILSGLSRPAQAASAPEAGPQAPALVQNSPQPGRVGSLEVGELSSGS